MPATEQALNHFKEGKNKRRKEGRKIAMLGGRKEKKKAYEN